MHAYVGFCFGGCIADTCTLVVSWVEFSLIVIAGYSCVVCLSLDYLLRLFCGVLICLLVVLDGVVN